MKIDKNGFLARSLQYWDSFIYADLEDGQLSVCSFWLSVIGMSLFGLAIGAIAVPVLGALFGGLLFPVICYFDSGVWYFSDDLTTISLICWGMVFGTFVALLLGFYLKEHPIKFSFPKCRTYMTLE